MKIGLYTKIATDGMRKNRRLYMPFIITCVLMVAVFYIMHFLGYSGILDTMKGGRTATVFMQFGTYIMAIFSVIFLFYTQSSIIKGRKKEFGLYSILGMNKRNLGRIIFIEIIITWAVSVITGLVCGIALSKFAELGLTKMIAVPVRYTFSISGDSVIRTIMIYGAIFFLIFLNSIRHVRFSSPIALVTAGKAGEKPPKSHYIIGFIGLAALAAGYTIALMIQQPIAAIMWFFAAVILVIIGTYLLLIAGSVILCKLLKKNKNYYYRSNHFVSVSTMTYRMKRNGASLASICILLTMILVMLSSTAALFFSSEECLKVQYPNEIVAHVAKYGCDSNMKKNAAKLDKTVREYAEKKGSSLDNIKALYEYDIAGYMYKESGVIDVDEVNSNAFINYDNVTMIHFIDIDDYNRLTGSNETLPVGEAMLGTTKKDAFGDEITIEDVTFKITKRIDDRLEDIDPTASLPIFVQAYLVVNDVDDTALLFSKYKIDGYSVVMWNWNSRFDTGLSSDEQIALSNDLSKYLADEYGEKYDTFYCDSREEDRDDFVSTYGGLFFLGIMLSIVFLISCVVIMYYKQISEGFEDQSRFEIMQKVGMTGRDIKKSINSQMLTVFLIPIILACVHLAMVLPIVNKLLMLFGLFNMPFLLLVAGICAVSCGIFYMIVYKVTSGVYYRIVS